jgi:hypothetical protein
MTMVERVAKAMLEDLKLRPSDGGEHGCLVLAEPPDRNVVLRGHVWLDQLASAAIAAMREPTPRMLDIANSKSGLTAWKKMIDEALK